MVTIESARIIVVSLCTAALLGTACRGRSAQEVVQPVGETHTTASSTGGARSQGRDSPSDAIGVVISDDLRRACDLPLQAGEAPRFDFDSAALRPRGRDILASVASCIATGKIASTTLEVVGHTDPRGPSEYNEQLGSYRAIAAKQHLVDLGAPAGMLVVESRGERDARGSDEASWALDRRVEIRFARPTLP